MVTLTHSSGMTSPVRVLSVTSIALTTASRSIVHELVGSATPDVTVRPAGPRTATLQYVLASRQDGLSCEALHRTPGPITVDDPGVLTLVYLVTGVIRLSLDPVARRSWILQVDVTEARS